MNVKNPSEIKQAPEANKGKEGKRGKMLSPCIREASETCLHGCCPAPNFLGNHGSSTSNPSSTPKSTETVVTTFRYDFTLATASSLCPDTQFTNHESLPSLQESYSYFIKAYPQFSQTDQADHIRAHEYYHLTLSNQVCLDYIGHGLFSYSQQQTQYNYPTPTIASTSSSPPPPQLLHFPEPIFFDISYKSVNLHTQVVYGGQESEVEFEMRKRIMGYMNISECDYTMVFTANQSSAFKLLADCYPFQKNPSLLTVYDYKCEAVDVMTESSKKRGGRVMSAEFSWPNMRIQSRKLRKRIGNMKKTRKKQGLFVFPLQSRMTGARYSYMWMSIAQENGWHVLLDACSLGPKDMDTLGLSLFQPDFLICSFFKVFGENPSGFGCLFVKKSSASVLKDSTFASSIGIVSLVPPSKPSEYSEDSISMDIETDKKQSKLENSKSHEIEEVSIKQKAPSLSELMELDRDHFESSQPKSAEIECRGLDHADSLGLVLISSRARYLINWLVNALMSLQHPHSQYGHQLVRIYGPKIKFERGPSLAFNVFDWKGEKIDPLIVQKLADRNNISLSNGILNHIGFSDKHEEERETKLEKCASDQVEGSNVVNKRKDERHSGISVVTAALGFLTNFEDIYRLWAFVSRFSDADFVEKERWRYMALNQSTVEI
ncbi:molybdenum cofactor sulfurase 3 [Prunus yedoensis var. nudiflora]|uniref:Molybdenum cofactor sulfurase 3 n=1 Tax=Prunus yedoensis var. nudiflora TaxID=2094558 RepID=A0A314Z570_PRUYE|nr:molybdenum cofactor sulfurase 3 [Prunus yedoensis var. nudiflora]